MRKLLLLVVVFVSVHVFGQIEYDTRLNVAYTNEYIQALDQQSVKQLEYNMNHSYFIIENYEKNEYLPELYKRNNQTKEIIEEPLTNVDFNNFNVLNYAFEKKYNIRTYYKIGNTGKTIVFYSLKEYTHNYNLTK